jgi:hypothetical protein
LAACKIAAILFGLRLASLLICGVSRNLAHSDPGACC